MRGAVRTAGQGGDIMKISATPELCAHVYTMLRATPPFSRWKLPVADDVVFVVTGTTNKLGEYFWRPVHRIEISQPRHGTLHSLTRTMAHEMVHMREYLTGERMDVSHGAAFNRLAKQVCTWHGFEQQEFSA
jgi:hypothetical protein